MLCRSLDYMDYFSRINNALSCYTHLSGGDRMRHWYFFLISVGQDYRDCILLFIRLNQTVVLSRSGYPFTHSGTKHFMYLLYGRSRYIIRMRNGQNIELALKRAQASATLNPKHNSHQRHWSKGKELKNYILDRLTGWRHSPLCICLHTSPSTGL